MAFFSLKNSIGKISKTEYFEHLDKEKQAKNIAQFSNQYDFFVNLVKPVSKGVIPKELIKAFTLKYKGYEVESSRMGTYEANYYSGGTPLSIDVTFNEIINQDDFFEDGLSIYDYFFKNGTDDILPTDGTILLPTEHYCYIECYSLDRYWQQKELFKGYCLITGEPTKDFGSESNELQEFTLTFKPFRTI